MKGVNKVLGQHDKVVRWVEELLTDRTKANNLVHIITAVTTCREDVRNG